jgi:Zn-dependent peptidase ImmA (M78 family)
MEAPRYRSEPISRQTLRNIAHAVRCALGLSKIIYFPILQILDCVHLFVPGSNYEILPADKMEKHAEIDVVKKTIYIREDIYLGACNGNGRDRMTISHEFSHLILINVLGFKFSRTFSNKKLKAYEDPEWQAKCLAGELMMNSELILGMDANEIVSNCGVSKDAAEFQLSRNKKDAPFLK